MRKFILCFIVLAFTSAFVPSPAAAQYRQGGVVPCSADDYRFVPGRGWVSNCRRGGNVVRGGYGRGGQVMRGGSSNRSNSFSRVSVSTKTTVTHHVVPTGTVRVKTGTLLVNRRTGEQIFIPAR